MLPSTEQIVHHAAQAALARMMLASCMADPAVSLSELCETVASALRVRSSGWVRTEHRVQADDAPSGRARVRIAMLHQGQITLIDICEAQHDHQASVRRVQHASVLRSDGYPAARIAYVMIVDSAATPDAGESMQTFRYCSPTMSCVVSVLAVQR